MQDFRTERMNSAEAASYLGVTEGTLRNWRYEGTQSLPYRKVGRLVYYTKSDLDKWLDGNTRTNTAAK